VITNGEFLAFVEAGGYTKQELWTEEGWRWVQFRQAKHPTFWVCDNGCKSGCGSTLNNYSHCQPESDQNAKRRKVDGQVYRYRCIYDEIDMPWDWPVDANYHEAKAFCKWKGNGYRLLTEAEHKILMDPNPVKDNTDYAHDFVFHPDFKANLHLTYGSSTPVNMFPPNKAGVYDLHGNVWQWLEDHFNGLPNFKTSYLYDDFSAPCFDSRHSMITGGSFISTGDEASIFARFSFRRHFFQHCGFRLVRSTNPTPVRLVNLTLDLKFDLNQIPNLDEASALVPTTNCHYNYEGDSNLRNSLLESYSTPLTAQNGLNSSEYTSTIAELIEANTAERSSALVVGSATGALPFALSKTFNSVLGADYCGRFICSSTQLQSGHKLSVPLTQEAVSVPEGSNPDRVIFKQLTWIPVEVGSFPVVVFHDYLERAMQPYAWLVRLREVVRDGGIAVISSRGGIWNADSIAQHIHQRFELLETKTVTAVDASGPNPTTVNSTVTVWKKK